ncbi:MAG TPA: dihydrolipoamide acetyltransferase family protein [Chlamydiales bacterium]|jgi:2-oxoglutarate dehydrogenase E2 component (dihydrolipoamide succinyltransferase)
MNEPIKINLPKLGESILSATIVQWFKKVGDRVERDEPLLEVSTDKVNSEIPSPVAGVLQEILAEAGQELQVGAPLAVIGSAGSIPKAAVSIAEPITSSSEPTENDSFLSPAVLRLLQEKNIPLSKVDEIPRSGPRLSKKDVEQYCAAKPACPKQAPVSSSSSIERVKMTSMRKAIADNMVKSFYEAPHASLITEVDVTDVMKTIAKEKQAFLEKHGVKLTITAYVARAIARALSAYPLINSSLDADTIVMKRFVNLGVAVSVDQGVMVPVIKNCQSLSISEIAKEIAALADKARTHKLSATDVQEGTITMTNFGMTGTLIGVPIIRYPEVAIVGLGAITKKVAAMPDDSIAIRSVMMVSLTFDHRVLDGLYGCGFLSELKKHLEVDIK